VTKVTSVLERGSCWFDTSSWIWRQTVCEKHLFPSTGLPGRLNRTYLLWKLHVLWNSDKSSFWLDSTCNSSSPFIWI